MSEIAKMELTHPMVVASSADTLRRCVKHIADGGRSERDLRNERGGLLHPGNSRRIGHCPEHGTPVPEASGSGYNQAAPAAGIQAGPVHRVHGSAACGRIGELRGAVAGVARPVVSGGLLPCEDL